MKHAIVCSCVLFLMLGSSQLALGQGGRGGTSAWGYLSEKYDQNNDGKIDKSEYERSGETYSRLDANKDGVLTKDDWSGGRRRTSRRGEPGSSAPRAGQKAPDFELSQVRDPDSNVRLSSFAGKKPVALIFGSCT